MQGHCKQSNLMVRLFRPNLRVKDASFAVEMFCARFFEWNVEIKYASAGLKTALDRIEHPVMFAALAAHDVEFPCLK